MKLLIKKIIWYLQGGYRPQEFWDKWSKTFMNDIWQTQIHPQHEWIIKIVKHEKPDSVLEVGCGFGRNIKYLIENGVVDDQITGVDISQKMIKKARKYINSSKVHLKVANVSYMSFKDSSFDLVFSHGVLMHVKPQSVEKALKEMMRVSKNTLIIVEQNYGGNEYTFIHDYKNLLLKNSISIVEYKHSKKLGLDLIYAKVRK